MIGRKGFTILEVLIFIAVSALIFFAAMTAISGRQNQVQFAQSTRDFESKIRDLINDVSAGYYPTNDTVDCNTDLDADRVDIVASTNKKLGTNNACIYIGKAIQFLPDSDETKIRTYVLAGKRYIKNGEVEPVTSIDEAGPRAIAKPGDALFTETVQEYTLLYGLKIKKVIVPSIPAPNERGVIAIISNFGGSLTSESQTVQVGTIYGSEPNHTEDEALDVINRLTDDLALIDQNGFFDKSTEQGIIICLENFDGRLASVTIGVKGSATTTLQMDDYNVGCE